MGTSTRQRQDREIILKKIIALAAFAAATVAPAVAQEVRPAFTGPYVAGMIGYDKVRLSLPGVGHASDDGLLYGGVVGYDINVRGAIFGVEGEYADSAVKESVNNVLFVGDRVSVKTGRDLYAGVRIGGEVAPNVMLYAKGGYTNAKGKLSYSLGGTTLRDSDNLEGYRLGAGVETNMMGLLGRLEYRYSSYGEYRGTGLDVQRHQIALLVGYRF